MRRALLAAPLLSLALAGCGGGSPAPASTSAPGGGSPPPAASSPAPGVGGLGRAVDAARGAVSQSQQDALRAAGTSAGQ